MWTQESRRSAAAYRCSGFPKSCALLALVVVLLAVAACSGSAPAPGETEPAPPANGAPAAGAPGGSSVPAGGSAAATPNPPSASPRTILARGEGNGPGTWVEVAGLSRGADGMVTLKFTLVNELGAEEIGGYDLVHPDHQVADFATVGGVHLVDSRTMTKIEVDRGPGNRCLCSRRVSVRPGGRAHVWAKYSALDPATARVSVMVPGFEPIDDVPITPADAAVVVASSAAPLRSESETPGAWIEVTELSRGSDGSVMAKFTLVNESQEGDIGGYDLGHPDFEVPDFARVGGVYLLDGRSMTKWDVDRDTAGKCICSEGISVRPGQRLRVWAKFSSIPAETTAITVVVPGFEPVENVAIGAAPTT